MGRIDSANACRDDLEETDMIFLIILAALLGNPISILLLLSAMDDFSRADEVERMERQAERRHKEMLEEQKKSQEIVLQESKNKKKINRTRRILRDEKGKFIAAEEIIEEEV